MQLGTEIAQPALFTARRWRGELFTGWVHLCIGWEGLRNLVEKLRVATGVLRSELDGFKYKLTHIVSCEVLSHRNQALGAMLSMLGVSSLLWDRCTKLG